jgi:hypothetical protein
MDISKFTQASMQYIKPAEVKDNPTAVFVITTEGKVVDTEFKGQKSQRVHVEGEFNKQARTFDMSKTNARIIEKALGADTSKWIGHQLFLEVYKTKASDGKLMDAINIREVK